jgi:hypothetical protein
MGSVVLAMVTSLLLLWPGCRATIHQLSECVGGSSTRDALRLPRTSPDVSWQGGKKCFSTSSPPFKVRASDRADDRRTSKLFTTAFESSTPLHRCTAAPRSPPSTLISRTLRSLRLTTASSYCLAVTAATVTPLSPFAPSTLCSMQTAFLRLQKR